MMAATQKIAVEREKRDAAAVERSRGIRYITALDEFIEAGNVP
jgi:hypothetical protein